MSFQDRASLISNLESIRGSTKVITYVTSTRPGLETQMGMDSIRKIHKLLQKITTPKAETKIDLFIHSNGGDGIVPWKLVTLIREYCSEFNVLVPFRAFSAATLTAIGADGIFMHPMGMLGPTDPKVANDFNPRDPGNPKNILGISVEDVISYISLVKDDIGIRHEDELVKALELLANESRVHPLALGNVKRFYAQSRMMAKKLLELHMDKTNQEHKIEEIADNLNSKLYFHGHPINRSEAKEQLGLEIKDTTPELEDAIWKLYESYEEEMMLDEPFDPFIEFKRVYPTLTFITPQNAEQEVKSHKLEKLKVVFIEGSEESYSLSIDLLLQGFKNLNGGAQELVSTSQVDQKWEHSLNNASGTPSSTRNRGGRQS